MKKIKKFSLKIWLNIKPYLTLKGLLSMGIAWLITNGWSWVFIILGPLLYIPWMTKVGIGFQVLAWQPWFVEKPITFAIGVWLHNKIFGEDPEVIE